MEDSPNINSIDWRGVSFSEIYGTDGPWNYSVNPLFPSKYHSVLFELPVMLNDPPKPHYNSQIHHWDDDHVKMPFSSKNLFPVKNEDGEVSLKYRWDIIQEVLLQPINNSKELEQAISEYNHKLPKFLALHHFFEEVLEEEETEHFFTSVLPGIIRLALRLPQLIPGNISLLKRGVCKSISLSQLQIASILANGFLCTFPWRKEMITYPGINFVRLFAAHLRPQRENSISEKLKCICHYFRTILAKEPVGVVTFERKFIPKANMPRWDRLENILGNTKVHVTSIGTIEDNGLGLLQVDFANKYIGGGVLGFGCVQEEIRYVICPELIVGRLFTEQLGPNEAFIVTGIERYSNYLGYGDSFVWHGHHNDETPYDKYGRRQTTVVAIDATHFSHQTDQFSSSFILRELNKAYTGFHSRNQNVLPAVATGNWGCGAFRGDANLKSLIQLMACNAAHRDMVYFTFGDKSLREKIFNMYLFLANNQITIVQLWRLLCRFHASNLKPESLYSYIQQTYLENKNKFSIKQYFSYKKEDIKEMPSTSKTNDRKVNEEQVIISQDVDEIDSSTDVENSPIEALTLHKKPKIMINKDTSITHSDKHTEIVNLMNLMDGKSYNNHVFSDNNSDTKISTILEHFSNKQKNENNSQDSEELQNMEVEEILPENIEDVHIGNKNKGKITHYFNKISK